MIARYAASGGGVLIGSLFYAPGEEFESDLPPGRSWRPLNDEALARCVARDEERSALYAEQAGVDVPVPDAVMIPPDWMELRGEKIVNLARRLGASGKCNVTQAIGHIEKVIAARTEQDAQMQGAA